MQLLSICWTCWQDFNFEGIGSNVNFEICTPSLKLTALAAPKNGWMVGRRLFPFGAFRPIFYGRNWGYIYHIPLWQVDAAKYRLRGWGFFHHQCVSKTPRVELMDWGVSDLRDGYISRSCKDRFCDACHVLLGGGFKHFWNFHPENWGRFPIWLIFFRWVGSTTYQFTFFVFSKHHPLWLNMMIFHLLQKVICESETAWQQTVQSLTVERHKHGWRQYKIYK